MKEIKKEKMNERNIKERGMGILIVKYTQI